MGKAILIASGKGGVGKTIFTANLGVALAQKGISVVLLDMSIGMRSLDICLGLENRIVYDFSDVLSGICSMKQALIRDRRFPKLYLAAAPQYRKRTGITAENMKSFCKDLEEVYDIILIDSSGGLDECLLCAAAAASKAIIVTAPEYASIRDAEVLDQILQESGIKQRCIAINKVMKGLYRTGMVPDPEDIASCLRLPVCGIIAYDENIRISSNIGVPVGVKKDGNYIARNFSRIAERLFSG
jgi:septum site-determining protein MinD